MDTFNRKVQASTKAGQDQPNMNDQTVNTTKHTLKDLPSDRVIRLTNVSCPYCGVELANEKTDKEHVIARKFVPKGKLHASWNLIVNSCERCNRIKADLEDDISAITMQPDALGRFGHADPTAEAVAIRKAEKSSSRLTHKPVKDSHVQTKLTTRFGQNASVSFGFVAPPQLDSVRAFDLARFQLMAFFYWMTYQTEDKRGYWWPGGFHPILQTNRTDWGNPLIRAFADAVVSWEPRVFGSTADGFYKVAIRKHPQAECWSWAIEWNHASRLVGFIGDFQEAQNISVRFPKLEMHTISEASTATIRYREEVPLRETEDDKLFCWDEETG